jgi:hypothetical protein
MPDARKAELAQSRPGDIQCHIEGVVLKSVVKGRAVTVSVPQATWVILPAASYLRRGRCDRQASSLFPWGRMDPGSHSLRAAGS